MPPLVYYFKGSSKRTVFMTVRQMFYVLLITPMAAAYPDMNNVLK